MVKGASENGRKNTAKSNPYWRIPPDGFVPDMMPENAQGIPARITAVFKERYALVCEYGEIYGKLKTKEYFGGFEEFPTTGDFVLINYNLSGDSLLPGFLQFEYAAYTHPQDLLLSVPQLE